MSGNLNRVGRWLLHRLQVILGAVLLTVAFFLVLPLMQAISAPPDTDVLLTAIDTGSLPPPPDVVEEEPPEEEPEDEPPPELEPEAPPLDLSQLEMALNPGFAEGWMGADFAVNLQAFGGGGEGKALFSMSDLDQKPRVIYQASPILSPKVRKKAPGTVYIIFIVNDRGRVENPIVQSSTDPIFESPAVAAVKKWKFEPGKRNGKAVSSRMRVPITFPKG